MRDFPERTHYRAKGFKIFRFSPRKWEELPLVDEACCVPGAMYRFWQSRDNGVSGKKLTLHPAVAIYQGPESEALDALFVAYDVEIVEEV